MKSDERHGGEDGPRHGGMANGQCSRGWGERCARSKGKRCKCACGGSNHGKALPPLTPTVTADGLPAVRIPARFQVGDVVEVLKPCLGNPGGVVAVCYEVYRRGDGSEARSFIFPNGSYDGFSDHDCYLFEVGKLGSCPELRDYQFTNVSKLWLDWKRGVFTVAFERFSKAVA